MKQRTHRCGELTKKQVGQSVVLNGWVQRWRDHGAVMFIDLRDRTGLTQVVFNAERNGAVHRAAHTLRSECVVSIAGQVMARPDESKNPNLPTGEIEVFVDEVEILNEAKTPPFVIEDEAEVTEAIRLKYRYLDLRRSRMQTNIRLRHRVVNSCIHPARLPKARQDGPARRAPVGASARRSQRTRRDARSSGPRCARRSLPRSFPAFAPARRDRGSTRPFPTSPRTWIRRRGRAAAAARPGRRTRRWLSPDRLAMCSPMRRCRPTLFRRP